MAKQGSPPMTTPTAKSLSLPTTDSQLYTGSGVSSVFWHGGRECEQKYLYEILCIKFMATKKPFFIPLNSNEIMLCNILEGMRDGAVMWLGCWVAGGLVVQPPLAYATGLYTYEPHFAGST